MVRTTFAWSLVALLVATAGCRMCAHPYDYTGPTDYGGCGQECMPSGRACSILDCGAPMSPATEIDYQMDSEMVPQAEPGNIAPIPDDMVGLIPGAEQPVGRLPSVRPQRFASRPQRTTRSR